MTEMQIHEQEYMIQLDIRLKPIKVNHSSPIRAESLSEISWMDREGNPISPHWAHTTLKS